MRNVLVGAMSALVALSLTACYGGAPTESNEPTDGDEGVSETLQAPTGPTKEAESAALVCKPTEQEVCELDTLTKTMVCYCKPISVCCVKGG